jgi:hypothetical protein
MSMKLFAAAALAVFLSSGVAFAQDNTQTGSTNQPDAGGAADASNYLTGPNIHQFYTDDSMTTLRPEAEVKSAWQAMNEDDRAKAKQACQGNKDTRWSTLCNSIGSM